MILVANRPAQNVKLSAHREAHRAKRCRLDKSSGFSSCTSCILYAFNLRSRRKMRQAVPYVSPSCCEQRRIDSPRSSCTLSATAAIFSGGVLDVVYSMEYYPIMLGLKMGDGVANSTQ